MILSWNEIKDRALKFSPRLCWFATNKLPTEQAAETDTKMINLVACMKNIFRNSLQ